MSQVILHQSSSDERRRLPALILAIAGIWMAVALLVGMSSVNPAMSQSLKSDLASGALGEGWNGLVVPRQNSAAGRANAINAKRMKIYKKRANETGQSVEVVGSIYAKEIYERARSGTWFLSKNNSWSQKP